jgi:type I restriction enzyme S subunit
VFKDFVDVDFAVLAMNSRYYRDQVEQAISGAEGLANNLPLSSLRDFVFAAPPLGEAQTISTHIRSDCNLFDKSIILLERAIGLIQEFRSRLIVDIVTGKLDVRAAAASLPDLTDFGPCHEPIEAEDDETAIEDAEEEEVAA